MFSQIAQPSAHRVGFSPALALGEAHPTVRPPHSSIFARRLNIAGIFTVISVRLSLLHVCSSRAPMIHKSLSRIYVMCACSNTHEFAHVCIREYVAYMTLRPAAVHAARAQSHTVLRSTSTQPDAAAAVASSLAHSRSNYTQIKIILSIHTF